MIANDGEVGERLISPFLCRLGHYPCIAKTMFIFIGMVFGV
jgi:hypothetical protein